MSAKDYEALQTAYRAAVDLDDDPIQVSAKSKALAAMAVNDEAVAIAGEKIKALIKAGKLRSTREFQSTDELYDWLLNEED